MVIHATKRGVPLPEPLLTQETVDARMREDKEAGLREYGNIFTSEGGDGQIIRRSSIIKNSAPRLPILYNEDSKRMFGIAYDPARTHDNSVIGIAEYYLDPDKGWKMRIGNFINLLDTMKKNKTPINTPSQIEILKQTILDYNGDQVADYENIAAVLVDAGSGGAGVPITDFLCEDWTDKKGVKHRGLIDPEYNEGDEKKFPNAVRDKLKLVAPRKYKAELFESAIKMMDLDLVEFPDEYLGKGYLELIFEKDKKGNMTQRYNYPTEEEMKALAKKEISIETVMHHLSLEEEAALKQIDAMKTEIVNIYRYKQSNGNDRFDLASDKANKMHDDRAYVFALLCWQLAQMRRSHIVNKKKQKQDARTLVQVSKKGKTWRKY